MKRCPDCGFHSKEPLKTCPLCGVRMREDPALGNNKYTGHVHKDVGEKCLLPNKGIEKPVWTYDKETGARPLPEKKPVISSGRSSRKQDSGKQIAGIVAVLLIYSLMRACGA